MKVDKWIWVFAGVMFILPLMFVASSIEPYACGLEIVSDDIKGGKAANCFEFWMNRYQTMVSGILALSAAGAAYWVARAQIRHAESLEEKRRQAEEFAARAGLSLPLDELCEYAKNCVQQFRTQLRNSAPQPRLQLPHFPQGAVEPLKNCIRFTDYDQAIKIYEVLSFLQILKARISSDEILSADVVYVRILDSVKLYILAEGILYYARGMLEGPTKPPPPLMMLTSLRRFGFNFAEDPQLFRLAGISVPPLETGLGVQSQRVVIQAITIFFGRHYGPSSTRERPHDRGGPSSGTAE